MKRYFFDFLFGVFIAAAVGAAICFVGGHFFGLQPYLCGGIAGGVLGYFFIIRKKQSNPQKN